MFDPSDYKNPSNISDLDEPTPYMLRRLKEGNIVEKLIILRKIGTIYSHSIISPLLDVVREGNEEIIEEVAIIIASKNKLFDSTIKTEIYNKNVFVRWTIALAIQKMNSKEYMDCIIPALGMGYQPVIKIISECLRKFEPNRFPGTSFGKIISNLTVLEKKKVLTYAIKQLGREALDITETLFALDSIQLLHRKESIVPLLKIIHHQDPRVKEKAESVLRYLGNKEIFEGIEHHLSNKDQINSHFSFNIQGNEIFPLSLYALEGLSRNLGNNYYQKQQEILFNSLYTGSQLEQMMAMKSIITLNQRRNNYYELSRDLRIKLKILIEELELEHKMYFINQLGKISNKWVIQAILTYLNDYHSDIKLSIIHALTMTPLKTDNILYNVAILLVDPNPTVRSATRELFWKLMPGGYGKNEFELIRQMDEPIKKIVLDRLTEYIKLPQESFGEAFFWVAYLEHEPAFQYLIKNINHPSEIIKEKTLIALGLFKNNRRIIKYLAPLIEKTEGRILEKIIQAIHSSGIDGVFELFHYLYKWNGDKYTHPEYLEQFIKSFGGKLMNYLQKEIVLEKDTRRKALLQNLFNEISKKYSVKTANDFKIFL